MLKISVLLISLLLSLSVSSTESESITEYLKNLLVEGEVQGAMNDGSTCYLSDHLRYLPETQAMIPGFGRALLNQNHERIGYYSVTEIYTFGRGDCPITTISENRYYVRNYPSYSPCFSEPELSWEGAFSLDLKDKSVEISTYDMNNQFEASCLFSKEILKRDQI